jgi:hypothetical protein
LKPAITVATGLLIACLCHTVHDCRQEFEMTCLLKSLQSALCVCAIL